MRLMTRIHDLRQSLARRFPRAFSQQELARRLGVTDRTYRRWETGEDRPSQRHLQMLARELAIGFKELDTAVRLERLQPLMDAPATYHTGDEAFHQVAVMVRAARSGQPLPNRLVVEKWLTAAEAGATAETFHGYLVREGAVVLRNRLEESEARPVDESDPLVTER